VTQLKNSNGTAGQTYDDLETTLLGGLDQGASTGFDRYCIGHIVQVERNSEVDFLDLTGTALRVYTTATSSTLVSSTDADEHGKIAGFVDAPDFDLLVTPPGGDSYTQRVRTSAPGIFHANSYGARPYISPSAMSSAVSNDVVIESNTAIQAAYAAAGVSGQWGATVQLGDGIYAIEDSIVPRDNVWMRGHGSLASRLYLMPGVNKPIIDSTSLAGARYNLEGIGFRAQDYDSHYEQVTGVAGTDVFTATAHGYEEDQPVRFLDLTGGIGITEGKTYYVIASGLTADAFKVSETEGGSTINFTSDISAGYVSPIFPLVLLKSYASSYQDLYFDEMPCDGLEMTGNDFGSGFGAANCNTFHHIVVGGVDGVSRRGIYFNDASGFKLTGGLVVSCDVGVYNRTTFGQPNDVGQIHGYHFENLLGYSYYSEGASGVSITACYIFSCPVGLDKNSHNNTVVDNMLLESQVYDGGRDNTVEPNKGRPHPSITRVPYANLYPASYYRDPDFSARATGAWTAVGGASFTKTDLLPSTVRQLDRGGRLPLSIAGAANKGASQVITGLTAGETYLVRFRWYSGVSGGVQATGQFKFYDNGGGTELFDSGALTRYVESTAEWNDDLYETVFQVPAAVTAVRTEFTTPDAGAIYFVEAQWIRSELTNGGFEGTYTAGVAADWAVTAGTGTASEETTLVSSGSSAQKLSVTAGQSLTLGQVNTPDEDSFYLLKCKVRVITGGIGRACIGWGNLDLNSFTDSQNASRASARLAGVEESLSVVFRPSTHTRALIGLTSDAGESASAIFDDLHMIKLKDVIGPLVYRTDEIDLTAASKDYLLMTPQNRDLRVRRIHFVYSVAATAVGPTIRVGTAGSSTYYMSMVGVNPQAVGDVLHHSGYPTTSATHTEIRRGVPLIVTHSGAVANSGKGYIVVEAE
jgi:hypothetical protein